MPGQHRPSPLNHQAADATLRRAGAWLVDALVVAVLTGIIAPTQAITSRTGETSWSWSGSTPWVMGIFVLLVALLVRALIPAAFGGSTLGMRLTGLQVTSTHGPDPEDPRASLTQHLVRSGAGIVDLAPWVLPGLVGWLVARRTPLHQRLGDLLAGTILVLRRDADALASQTTHPPWMSAVSDTDILDDAYLDALYGVGPYPDPDDPSDGPSTDPGADRPDDTAHTRTVPPIGPEATPSSDVRPPVTRSERRPSPSTRSQTATLEAPAPANGETLRPEWSDEWQAWLFLDPDTGLWFRHDPETARWLPT